MRDYTLALPSLDGILNHDSVSYGNLKRPAIINRIFDRPSFSTAVDLEDVKNKKVIEDYFHDLYSVIMKKISEFAVGAEATEEQTVKLLAMMQEFFKVKKLLQKH